MQRRSFLLNAPLHSSHIVQARTVLLRTLGQLEHWSSGVMDNGGHQTPGSGPVSIFHPHFHKLKASSLSSLCSASSEFNHTPARAYVL